MAKVKSPQSASFIRHKIQQLARKFVSGLADWLAIWGKYRKYPLMRYLPDLSHRFDH